MYSATVFVHYNGKMDNSVTKDRRLGSVLSVPGSTFDYLHGHGQRCLICMSIQWCAKHQKNGSVTCTKNRRRALIQEQECVSPPR